MRIVVALGGNALLRRGEPLTSENQLANIRRAAGQLARIVEGNELVLTHGNGPQVGLLALQAAEQATGEGFPLDVLGAQTDGMIGYLLEQELSNILPSQVIATLLTRVEVDPSDPAFTSPTKPIGPVYMPPMLNASATSTGGRWHRTARVSAVWSHRHRHSVCSACSRSSGCFHTGCW